MLCPGCGTDNIQGADLCESCGFDLFGLEVRGWGIDADDPVVNMRLEQLPLKTPLILDPSDSADTAIATMTEAGEGCVYIVDGGTLVGVVTERDIALRIANRGRDATQTTLEHIMTRDPVTLRATDTLAFALHRMGVDGYRHVPILKDRQMIGFISMRTVLGVLATRAGD